MIAIIGGGGAFVLLVAVLVLAFVLNSVAKSGQAVADDAEQATGTPEDAVTAYLQAVADGDAEAALGYLESTPSTTELLTDEVLMASAQQAPLTDITVQTSVEDDYSTTVKATYTVGDEPVDQTFDVYQDRDQNYKILGGTGRLTSYESFTGLSPTVNGVPITAEFGGERLDVFPGAYTLELDDEHYKLDGGKASVVVKSVKEATEITAKPVLTKKAKQLVRQAVKKSVDKCVSSKSMTTPCGIEVTEQARNGWTVQDGTITRKLTSDAKSTLDNLSVEPSYDKPMVIKTELIGSVDVTAQCTEDGGAPFPCELILGSVLEGPVVDISGKEPKVTW